MPSPLRSHSRFRFATSLFALAALAGCGDDESCGPGDEAAPGLTVEAGAVTFGELAASANNDCPPTAGEDVPTSVTIQGTQIEPAAAGQFLVLCLPRPDLIDDQPVSFTDGDRIELVDLFGRDADGCVIRFDRTAGLGNAAATFSGFCDNGIASQGFALSLSGVLPFTRTCDGEEPAAITSELSGRAAVTAPGG